MFFFPGGNKNDLWKNSHRIREGSGPKRTRRATGRSTRRREALTTDSLCSPARSRLQLNVATSGDMGTINNTINERLASQQAG